MGEPLVWEPLKITQGGCKDSIEGNWLDATWLVGTIKRVLAPPQAPGPRRMFNFIYNSCPSLRVCYQEYVHVE